MQSQFNILFAKLSDGVIRQNAALKPDTRHAIANNEDMPAEACVYIQKVHQHAYRVVDEDIDGLIKAGWSEDQVFEATISAAVGAATKRLDATRAAWEKTS